MPQAMLDEQGTVCADVAAAMADGVRRLGEADIGVAITGEAGPEAAEDKPVGTVFIGYSDSNLTEVKHFRFSGDREAIRRQTAEEALKLVLKYSK